MGRFTGFLGLVAILGLAWLLSTNRKAIRWQTAAWGLGLQWIFAVLVLRFDAGERALAAAGDAVNRMLAYAFIGSGFVFGDLGKQHSSYGLTICAERSAAVRAVAEHGPEMRVLACAITNLNQAASPPCGACLQVLSEFMLPASRVTFRGQAGWEDYRFEEVFPHRFKLVK